MSIQISKIHFWCLYSLQPYNLTRKRARMYHFIFKNGRSKMQMHKENNQIIMWFQTCQALLDEKLELERKLAGAERKITSLSLVVTSRYNISGILIQRCLCLTWENIFAGIFKKIYRDISWAITRRMLIEYKYVLLDYWRKIGVTHFAKLPWLPN